MNQYEIELRDKYFEMTLSDLMNANAHNLTLEACGKPSAFIKHDGMIALSNEFADKCMAERQKRLDAINEASPAGYILGERVETGPESYGTVQRITIEVKRDDGSISAHDYRDVYKV